MYTERRDKATVRSDSDSSYLHRSVNRWWFA
jgi:hypothetical protein